MVDSPNTFQPKPRSRWIRRGVFSAVVFGVFMGTYYASYFVANDEWLGRTLTTVISKNMQGKLGFGKLHWTPRALWDLLTFQDHDSTVHDFFIEEADGKRVVHVPYARAKIALWPLILAQEVHLKDVVVDKAYFSIAQRPGLSPTGGMRVNLTDAFEPIKVRPKKPGKGFAISANGFVVRNLELALTFDMWSLRVGTLALRGGLWVDGSDIRHTGFLFDSQGEAEDGLLTVRGIQYPLRRLRIDRSLSSRRDPGDIHVEMTVEVAGDPLTVRGKLKSVFSTYPTLDLHTTSPTVAGILKQTVGPILKQAPSVKMDIRGAFTTPILRGRVSGAAVASPMGELRNMKSMLVLDLAEQLFRFSELQAEVWQGHVRGEGSIDLSSTKWKTSLHLEALRPQRDVIGVSETQFRLLDGRLNGIIESSGQFRTENGFPEGVFVTDILWRRALRDGWPSLIKFKGTTHLKRRVLDFAGLAVQSGANRVRLRGSWDLSTHDVKLYTDLEFPELNALLRHTSLSGTVDAVRGSLRIGGTFPNLNAKGEIAADNIGYHTIRLPRLQGEMEFAKGTFTLSNVRSSGFGGVALGTMKLDFFDGNVLHLKKQPKMVASFKLQGMDLTKLTSSERFAGTCNGDLHVAGPLSALTGKASLNVEKFRYEGDPYERAKFVLSLHPDRVNIDVGELTRASGGRLTLSGSVDFTQQIALQARVAQFPLDGIVAVRQQPVPMEGLITGTIQVSGTLTKPRFVGTIAVAKAKLRKMVLGTGEFSIRSKSTEKDPRDEIEIRGALFGNHLQLDGTVMLRPHPSAQLRLKIHRFPLEKLFYELKEVGDIWGLASGYVSLDADAERGFSTVKAALSDLDLWMRYRPVGKRKTNTVHLGNQNALTLHYENGMLRVEPMTFNYEAGEQFAEFSLGGWASSSKSDIRLDGKVPLALLDIFLPRPILGVSGEANVELAMSGPLTRPALKGSLALTQVSIGIERFDQPILIPQAKVFLEPDTIVLKQFALQVGEQSLRASGRADLEQYRPHTIDVSLNGTVNARLLQLLFPEQIASAVGAAHLSITAQGPFRDPILNGDLAVERVEFSPRGSGRVISLVSGRLVFDNYVIKTLNPLRGNYDEGNFTIDGEVRLDNWQPADLRLSIVANEIPFRSPKVYLAEANMNLRLFGDAAALYLQGDVELVDARFIKEFDLLNFNLGERTYVESAPLWETIPQLGTMTVDLQARSAGNILIKNQYVEATLGGNVTVQGTLLDPALGGEIRVEEGGFRIPGMGAEFSIERGTLSFPGKTWREGWVSFIASTQVSGTRGVDYQIKASAQGVLGGDIGLTFQSVPSLEQGQILSLLTFGKTTDELRHEIAGPEGGGVRATDEQIRQITGAVTNRALSGWLNQSLQKTNLRVNRLEIGTAKGLAELCYEPFGRRIDICGLAEFDIQGGTRGQMTGGVQIHDYLKLLGQLERLSSTIETDDLARDRGRLELKFSFPIR